MTAAGSTRLAIVHRAHVEAREALAGLPLAPEVKALHRRLTEQEQAALRMAKGPTTIQERALFVHDALALTLDALALRRRFNA